MAPVRLADIAGYLDDYLQIAVLPDEPGAVNGLQVENGTGTVERVVAAVDLSQITIDGVAAKRSAGGTLLLVHHGLLWDGNIPVTGRRYRRLKGLLDHDIAVYSAHIPLDVHPEVGNNVVLARALGCGELLDFGLYKGVALGVRGRLRAPLSRAQLAGALDSLLATTTTVIAGGPESIETVAVITGAAGSHVQDAAVAGVDAFVTGEGAHYTYFDAVEFGVNLFYAGHYATERVGVQALARHLANRFGLEWEFHDHPTGL